MIDPITKVFNNKTLAKWRLLATDNPDLAWRVKALDARSPYPSGKRQEFQMAKARRVSWAVYLEAAEACGLLKEKDGKNDLVSRLRSVRESDFRGAMAECLACWTFSGKFGFPIEPRPLGNEGRPLEFRALIRGDWWNVEVKAPRRDREEGVMRGDDSQALESVLEKACSKFRPEDRNMLVICPQLRIPLSVMRRQLVVAFLGEDKIVMKVDKRTRAPLEEPKTQFFMSGRFTRPGFQSSKITQKLFQPNNTRIGGVLVIEEEPRWKIPEADINEILASEDLPEYRAVLENQNNRYLSRANVCWTDHNLLVVQNPYALHRIPAGVWKDSPELALDHGTMGWSDGVSVSY